MASSSERSALSRTFKGKSFTRTRFHHDDIRATFYPSFGCENEHPAPAQSPAPRLVVINAKQVGIWRRFLHIQSHRSEPSRFRTVEPVNFGLQILEPPAVDNFGCPN